MTYFKLFISGIYIVGKAFIQMFMDFGGPGRSDYNVGDKLAIVPEPLRSKQTRRRRILRRKFSREEKSE